MFSTPLPNLKLWTRGTYGFIQGQDSLHDGGWWHNPSILSAVGAGIDVEEPRGWSGCWNEKIVELAQLSSQDPDTLTVLLTGRQESRFAELISRIITARGLQFDMVVLRPKVGPGGQELSSTRRFKEALLKDVVFTYISASEIRIYEDRANHAQAFRNFFSELNRNELNKNLSLANSSRTAFRAPRSTIKAEVVQVTEQDTVMDPVTETAAVQRMINSHNEAILAGNARERTFPYQIKRTVSRTNFGEKVLLQIEKERGDDDDDEVQASTIPVTNSRKHPRGEEYPPLEARGSGGKIPRQRHPQRGSYGNAWQQRRADGDSYGSGIGLGAVGTAIRGQGNMRGRGTGGRGDGHSRPYGGRGRAGPARRKVKGTYRSLDDNVGQSYGGGGMQY